MTDRQKFALAIVIIASLLLVGGYITADHWMPVVQGVVVGA